MAAQHQPVISNHCELTPVPRGYHIERQPNGKYAVYYMGCFVRSAATRAEAELRARVHDQKY